jgi:hypothetical protein
VLWFDQMDILLVSLEIVRCCKAFRVGTILDPTFEGSTMCRRMLPKKSQCARNQYSSMHGASLLFGLVLKGLAALKAD